MGGSSEQLLSGCAVTTSTTRLHTWLARLTGLSALVAVSGLQGIVAVFGPVLATGLLFYGGQTEAVPAVVPYPWTTAGVVLGVAWVCQVVAWLRSEPAWGWVSLALAGVAAWVAIDQMAALMEAARP